MSQPLPGIYNIKIVFGRTDNFFLSTAASSNLVDMYSQDDSSGRQLWVLEAVNGKPNAFHIKNYMGRTSNYYLSCDSDGSNLVDMYGVDDNSGRQHWYFTKVANSNLWNITNQEGRSRSSYNYLSTGSDNNLVDLYQKDDGSGRQRWVVEPASDVVQSITNVQFSIPAAAVTLKPEVIASETYRNTSNQPLTYQFNISKDVTASTTFGQSNTFGVKVTQTIKISAGVPEFKAESTTSIEISASTTSSYGTTDTTTQTYQMQTPVTVLAGTAIKVDAVLTIVNMDVPYTADIIATDGKTYPISGMWNGVTSYNLIVNQSNA